MTSYDYLARVVVDATLEVEDEGNCTILARNDKGEEYYLIIKTVLGTTEMIEYGPCMPDFDTLPNFVGYSYSRTNFDRKKIDKTIDKFLNNPARAITQAEVIDIEDIRTFVKNPIDFV